MRALLVHIGTIGALALAIGCGSAADPASPTIELPGGTTGTTTGDTTAANGFPPLEGPSTTFHFARALAEPPVYAMGSRLIIYENRAFVLEYPSLSVAYRGRYSQATDTVTFEWIDRNAAGPWTASGVFAGDILTVRFNAVMQMADFEDAEYQLVR